MVPAIAKSVMVDAHYIVGPVENASFTAWVQIVYNASTVWSDTATILAAGGKLTTATVITGAGVSAECLIQVKNNRSNPAAADFYGGSIYYSQIS